MLTDRIKQRWMERERYKIAPHHEQAIRDWLRSPEGQAHSMLRQAVEDAEAAGGSVQQPANKSSAENSAMAQPSVKRKPGRQSKTLYAVFAKALAMQHRGENNRRIACLLYNTDKPTKSNMGSVSTRLKRFRKTIGPARVKQILSSSTLER